MKRGPPPAFTSSCYSEVTILAGLIRWGFVITQKRLTVMQLQTSLPRYLLCWVDIPTFCSRFTQWLSNCSLTAAYCTLKTEHTCHFELRCTETAENIRLLFTDVAGLGLGTEATGKRSHLPFINTPQLYKNMEVCSEVCVPDRSFCFILCTYLLWYQSRALRRDNLKVEMTQNITSKYLQPPEWQLPINQHAWEAWPCPPPPPSAPGIIHLSEGFHDRYPVEDYLDLFDQAAYQIQGNLSTNTSASPSQPNVVIGKWGGSFQPSKPF